MEANRILWAEAIYTGISTFVIPDPKQERVMTGEEISTPLGTDRLFPDLPLSSPLTPIRGPG